MAENKDPSSDADTSGCTDSSREVGEPVNTSSDTDSPATASTITCKNVHFERFTSPILSVITLPIERPEAGVARVSRAPGAAGPRPVAAVVDDRGDVAPLLEALRLVRTSPATPRAECSDVASDFELSDLELTPRKESSSGPLSEGQIFDALNAITPVKKKALRRPLHKPNPVSGSATVPEAFQRTTENISSAHQSGENCHCTCTKRLHSRVSVNLDVSKPPGVCDRCKSSPKLVINKPLLNTSIVVQNGDISRAKHDRNFPCTINKPSSAGSSSVSVNSVSDVRQPVTLTMLTVISRAVDRQLSVPTVAPARRASSTRERASTPAANAMAAPSTSAGVEQTSQNSSLIGKQPTPTPTPRKRGRPPKRKPPTVSETDLSPNLTLPDPTPPPAPPPLATPPLAMPPPATPPLAMPPPATPPPVTSPPAMPPPATLPIASPPPASPPPSVSVPPEVSHLSKNLELGYLILEDILRAARTLTKPFMCRPDSSMHGMESYYKFITRPMWLAEMKQKFERAAYKEIGEFVIDMRQMFENCYRFNGPGSCFTKKALKLEQQFEERIAALPPRLTERCSLFATHKFRAEDYPPLAKTSKTGSEYPSALLAKIVYENRQMLAADRQQRETIIVQRPMKVDVNLNHQTTQNVPTEQEFKIQKEVDRDELFKEMRLKMTEVLTDKEIEKIVCNDDRKVVETTKTTKKCEPKIEKVEEPVFEEEDDDEDLDYIDDLIDENYVETEEEKVLRELREKEDVEWEERHLYGGDTNKQLLRSTWEVPEIAHFVYSTLDVLNMHDIPLYEMERMLLMPQASRGLAVVMTSLLSGHILRQKLDQMPPMPYKVWTQRLKAKVAKWYRMYNRLKEKQQTVYDIDPQFWVILGPQNPLEEYEFHELSFHQRVWLLKGLCDFCFLNQKPILDKLYEVSMSDRDYRHLGNDASGARYFYLRPFCERDLRVYKEAQDPVPWQDKHDRHLADEERKRKEREKEEKPRGRKGRKKKQEASDKIATSPPKKVAKKKNNFSAPAPVRRSKRKRVGHHSYEDPPDFDGFNLNEDSENEWWLNDTTLPDQDRISGPLAEDNCDRKSGDTCRANETGVTDRCGTGQTVVCKREDDSDDTFRTTGRDVSAEEKCDIKFKLEKLVPCTCLTADQRCENCMNADLASDKNSAQNSDKKNGVLLTFDTIKQEPPDGQPKDAVGGRVDGPASAERRPLPDTHWLLPDPDNFLLVADSVQSLRDLIASFADATHEEDVTLNERLNNKQANKGRLSEAMLVKSLGELLEDFQAFELRLTLAVSKTRLRMRRQWEKFTKRPAGFLNKSERIWLEVKETRETEAETRRSVWQESETPSDSFEVDDSFKAEIDGTRRTCRARTRLKPDTFLDDEDLDFDQDDDLSHSGDDSDLDVWELPGRQKKSNKKKASRAPSPSASPKPKTPRKRQKVAGDSAEPSDTTNLAVDTPTPNTAGDISSALVIDLVDDDALPEIPPLPPQTPRPRQVLQTKHAVRRTVEHTDFDPDIICLSDEDDLPPPLKPKVIGTSNEHPFRLGDISDLLKGDGPSPGAEPARRPPAFVNVIVGNPSDKLTKLIHDTVKVYNESEARPGEKSGDVVLMPSMNERGEMVNVKKLVGPEAAKVLANKNNTQTRLPSNATLPGPSAAEDTQSQLKIVSVCSLSQPSGTEGLAALLDKAHDRGQTVGRGTRSVSRRGRGQVRLPAPPAQQMGGPPVFRSPAAQPPSGPPRGQRPAAMPRLVRLVAPRPASPVHRRSPGSPATSPATPRILSPPQPAAAVQVQTASSSSPARQTPSPARSPSTTAQKPFLPPEGHMVITPQGEKVYLLQQKSQMLSPVSIVNTPPGRPASRTVSGNGSPASRPTFQSRQFTSASNTTPEKSSGEGLNVSSSRSFSQSPSSTGQSPITPQKQVVDGVETTPVRRTYYGSSPRGRVVPSSVTQNATRQLQSQAGDPHTTNGQQVFSSPPNRLQPMATVQHIQRMASPRGRQAVQNSPAMQRGQNTVLMHSGRLPSPQTEGGQNHVQQQRVIISYAPQHVDKNAVVGVQSQAVYPQVVPGAVNPATGLLQALASRQSYAQQQVMQLAAQPAVPRSPQYQRTQAATARQGVLRSPQRRAESQVVTISDDSDEGGDTEAPSRSMATSLTPSKVVFVLGENGPQYATILPNGDRAILTAEEVARIREQNGGVLPT